MSRRRSIFAVCTVLMATSALAQVTLGGPALFRGATVVPVSAWFAVQGAGMPPADVASPDGAALLVRNFKESDIKFNLGAMMETLRDHRHEGWILAAYPDPITRRPLIGAGFSLDVPARWHLQTDPLNPHPFVEPSSAQLWQAAGLAPERLQQILDEFDHNVNSWTPKTYRRKVIRQRLTPQLSEEEGEQLLRISAMQAVFNARAYCRNFDQLSGPQQMALSQLVFQMGVNLEQFVSFLGVLNDPNGARELPRLDGYLLSEPEHWRSVQNTLMDSQWAHRYSVRAASVIAMFDPMYGEAPTLAEQRVISVLLPAVMVHLKTRGRATLRLASYTGRSGKGRYKKASRALVKRKLT